MTPSVEIGGYEPITAEGDVSISLASNNPVTVVFKDTQANRRAIDVLRTIRSENNKPTSVNVKPDQNGIVTYGIENIPLPKGYRQNDVKLNEFGFEIEKLSS